MRNFELLSYFKNASIFHEYYFTCKSPAPKGLACRCLSASNSFTCIALEDVWLELTDTDLGGYLVEEIVVAAVLQLSLVFEGCDIVATGAE